jgi:hypothetical protein
MVLARELAERFANLILARAARHAEHLVVISELDGHVQPFKNPASN